jgi:hypothetical protein
MTKSPLLEHQKFFKETKERLGTIIDKFGTDRVYNNIEVVDGIRERKGNSRIVYIPVSAKEKKQRVFLEVSTIPRSANFKYPLLHRGEKLMSLTTLHPSDIPPELKRQYRANIINKLKKLESRLGNFNVSTRESQ